MATYASYRHIELDKVGYSKKRVCNRSSEIFQVMSTSAPGSPKHYSPKSRSSPHNDSFNRLFGTPEPGTPRRSSISKHESSPRNPVTGDGVVSWDSRPVSRSTPSRPQRNPVTGETYVITKSPVSTPTKSIMTNGFTNGHHESPMINGKA